MISIARTLGAPLSVPAGRIARSASIAPTSSRSVAADRRDDVHDVRVVLDLHEAVDLDAAVLADAAEVVAPEVDEHHVLGALLLVGQQLVRVGVAPRARAGDRASRRVPAGDRQQRLGRGAGDLEVQEVQEVHVGRRVDDAQPAVDRERVDAFDGALQRCDGTTGRRRRRGRTRRSARPCPRSARAPCWSGTPAPAGRGGPARAWARAVEQAARFGDRGDRVGVGLLEVVGG